MDYWFTNNDFMSQALFFTICDSELLFLRLCPPLQTTCLCNSFLLPSTFFSPSHSWFLFFQGRERISCNVVSYICTSRERQGELGRQGNFHLSGSCEPLQPQSEPWPWATAGCCHFTLDTSLWICLGPLWGFQHTAYMIFFPPLTLPAISYLLPSHEFMLIQQNPPPSKWTEDEIWSFM